MLPGTVRSNTRMGISLSMHSEDSGGVHDMQALREHIDVADGLEALRIGMRDRIGIVDARRPSLPS